MTIPRVALATGSLHLPGKHFVLDHSLELTDRVETKLFTYAARGTDYPSLDMRELFAPMKVPYDLRRRLYPIGSRSLGRSILRWNPDIIHLHFMALGGFAARASKSGRVPLITTVHALEPHLMNTPRTQRDRNLRQQCLEVLEATTLFLPVSEYIRQWLISLGVPKTSIAVNYLGIDTEFWQPRRAPDRIEGNPHLLFVGNLTELKGIRELIDVSVDLLEGVPHTLDVVGDGPLRDYVDAMARKHPHIKVHGLCSRERVRNLMHHSHVFALPTHTHNGISEAASFVLMEAQSMGLATVCFQVGGTAEMMADPSLLVKEGDTNALTEVLLELLTLDEAALRLLGKAARDWIVQNRSLRAGARSTLGHYRSAVASDAHDAS